MLLESNLHKDPDASAGVIEFSYFRSYMKHNEMHQPYVQKNWVFQEKDTILLWNIPQHISYEVDLLCL